MVTTTPAREGRELTDTMSRTKLTTRTADHRIVTIRTRTVGQSFGTIGQVVARNGRVLAETDTKPYGFHEAAEQAARDLAGRIGAK